jgi:hypothetical protein
MIIDEEFKRFLILIADSISPEFEFKSDDVNIKGGFDPWINKKMYYFLICTNSDWNYVSAKELKSTDIQKITSHKKEILESILLSLKNIEWGIQMKRMQIENELKEEK